MIFEILNIFTGIMTSVGASLTLIIFKTIFDKKQNQQEAKEIQEDADKIIGDAFKSDDVIDLMLKNVRELREYYIISKRQATNAFSASLIVCFLGFIVYVAGIAVFVFSGEDTLLLTTISGTIVEVISGLFFGLYRHAIKQLNIYHQRLGTTEKYLTAIRLVDKMGQNQHDTMYRHIIECILIDNRMQLEKVPEEKKDKDGNN
ncbi:hypothetical protein C823_005197 [Eubacterium plexicaudatum ASF492]|uniref:Cyanobacterial TRADD-N associated 2 transmembrane domain-containing protein n=1 Tax=Eubacterium plexicaudatum ASF492 TaxID=1235802 RepID=N2B845_9FIRM|nr:hypothetical protein C823_005197 [Eubacterium plexicaudatum ASF492]